VRKFAFILSLVVIFTIPWEDAFTIAGLNSITRYAGILASGVWLVSVFFRRKIRRLNAFHVFLIVFSLWNVASLIWTVAYDYTYEQAKTYLQLFLLILIIWDLITTKNELFTAMQAYVLGCYIAIVTTIINYSIGRTIRVYDIGRYAGVGNAVELALTLTLGLPLAWHLATANQTQNNKFLRTVNFIYIPLSLFAILLTGTRMALLAVIPAFIYILWTYGRIKPLIRVSSFFALMGSMFFLEELIPSTTIDRLGTIINSITSGDLGGRVILWKRSLLIFTQSPLIGMGSGVLRSPLVLGTQAHNTFISVLAELGLIGLLLFLFILIIVFQHIFLQEKDLSRLWMAIFSIWVIGVSTLTWEHRKVTWLLFTFIIIGASIHKSNSRKLNNLYLNQ
jgi:O-antigen ligase